MIGVASYIIRRFPAILSRLRLVRIALANIGVPGTSDASVDPETPDRQPPIGALVKVP